MEYTFKPVTLKKISPVKPKKRPLWKRVIIYAVVALLLVVLIPRIMAFSFGTAYPMAVITSNSMWPNLSRGDLIFIAGVSEDQFKVGDVIAFHDRSGITVHRIVGVEKDLLITRGDANIGNDFPVTAERVIGRVISFGGGLVKIPMLGYITIWSQGEVYQV